MPCTRVHRPRASPALHLAASPRKRPPRPNPAYRGATRTRRGPQSGENHAQAPAEPPLRRSFLRAGPGAATYAPSLRPPVVIVVATTAATLRQLLAPAGEYPGAGPSR